MKIKALVIDRRSVERNELTRPLKELGVRKVVERNAQEIAAEPVEAGQYDVVFIEFNTLMEAGQPLAGLLRAMDANVPIIVTYPPATRPADLKKYCPQATACLGSPFTNEQLRQTMEQCVASLTV